MINASAARCFLRRGAIRKQNARWVPGSDNVRREQCRVPGIPSHRASATLSRENSSCSSCFSCRRCLRIPRPRHRRLRHRGRARSRDPRARRERDRSVAQHHRCGDLGDLVPPLSQRLCELRDHLHARARRATRWVGSESIDGEWGWTRITRLELADGTDLLSGMSFERPDDGNENDFTVARVELPREVLAR